MNQQMSRLVPDRQRATADGVVMFSMCTITATSSLLSGIHA